MAIQEIYNFPAVDFQKSKYEGGMTYEEIAAELGLSRERVRQIEQEAMKKIRKYLVQTNRLTYKDFKSDCYFDERDWYWIAFN